MQKTKISLGCILRPICFAMIFLWGQPWNDRKDFPPLSSSSSALLVRRLKVFWRAETLQAALKPHRDVVPCHKPCELSYHFLIWLTLISVSNIESGPVLVELLHVNAIQRNDTKKSLRWLVCCHILPPLCVPSCSSPPHSCLPWLCRFCIRPVLWQSCFLQRMCTVRNHWCEPQLKTPELCSGGCSLAKVVSLGMGVGKWAGSFDTSLWDEAGVRTCWWHLWWGTLIYNNINALAMLPREWEVKYPAASRHIPKNPWSGFLTLDAG